MGNPVDLVNPTSIIYIKSVMRTNHGFLDHVLRTRLSSMSSQIIL
jgi:hypothetical protein